MKRSGKIVDGRKRLDRILELTYTERFHLLMNLIKMHKKLSEAKIVYPKSK